MITPQDKLSAEQEAERQYWEQVEARARHHEQLSNVQTGAARESLSLWQAAINLIDILPTPEQRVHYLLIVLKDYGEVPEHLKATLLDKLLKP